MSENSSIENDFLNKVTGIIMENLSDVQFGVSELAREAGMSRSNLLRKIKKLTNISASQFIRQVRLQQAMEMLKQSSLNVTEVSFETGFNSTSYFIKCFREYYGYPPGDAGKRDVNGVNGVQQSTSTRKRKTVLTGIISTLVILIALLFIYLKPFSSVQTAPEKSIAVLPFINDSNDSSNIYIINGLMESVLNDLQKIEDLRVISRTSVEKYRNARKTIPEMAKELNVNYFVEGSGQKIGDQIMLHIQLIDAVNDKHLLSEQYNRKAKDIFKLQTEVAKNIASRIQAVIKPEEQERIEKIPTDNLVAYDYFLKGMELFRSGNPESLEDAIGYFKKAIAEDSQFGQAYANIAIAYYYLDFNRGDKKNTELINTYADKALLSDPKLTQGLVAKALFYIAIAEYKQAEPYLEKAHEYNPNSAYTINLLSDFYTSYIPNTEKYLEYALKGIRLNIAANDSATASFIYLHVSNAFAQTGFIDEALKYINKSLEYNPGNLFSQYVKAYIIYAKNRNLDEARKILIETLEKDTTRWDIIQEAGKICYYMRDYESAYKYYKRFIKIKESQHMNIYPGENAKIGVVLSKVGLTEKSDEYFEDYRKYAENDKSIYKHLSLAMYYSHKNDTKKALEQLKLFSQQDNYHFWIILFLKIDPLVDNIKEQPEFKKILRDIETKFRKNHQKIKRSLEQENLL